MGLAIVDAFIGGHNGRTAKFEDFSQIECMCFDERTDEPSSERTKNRPTQK